MTPSTAHLGLPFFDDAHRELAPRLVAKGKGKLAERILEEAQRAGVPIHRDPDLMTALEPLDVDQAIPPELFQAVAVILAALYRANGRMPEPNRP